MKHGIAWLNLVVVLAMGLLSWPASLQAGAAPTKADPAPPPAPLPSSPPLTLDLQQASHLPDVDPQILSEMAASGSESTTFFILFGSKADLSHSKQIQDWSLRGWFVYDALHVAAEQSQSRVRAWLDSHGIAYHSFFTDNSLFVTADKNVLRELAAFPEIVGFRANHIHPLEPIVDEAKPTFPEGVAWGIALVGADQVWQDFGIKGQGIVVANVDTGVEYTHDALHVNYKCGDGPHADCWYDPSAICPDPSVPCDNAGHGTHTMGTMAGDDDPGLAYNAGMAPDAQWIACKGCEYDWCSDFALTACADWILAPNGNPDNRPNVVNNSWGGGGCNDWYRDKVQAWRAAGIFPAFSAGNMGSDCSSLGSPGDYPESFASGATDSSDQVAWFSSRGPSCYDEIKPEASAPGVDVCSSVPGNGWDCSYSGTSMASPHTAGLAALLWSANPGLIGDIDATEHVITSTATCLNDLSCGGEECHNNVYGWGRIDAYAAVSQVAFTGYLDGHVQDTGGAPLPGVTIQAEREAGGPFTDQTDASGYYTMSIPTGTYSVTAALYGYYPQTVTGIEVITDEVTTQDFVLAPTPFYQVSGQVTDAQAGWPLYAHLTVKGDPLDPPPPDNSVWIDPLFGDYSLTLAAGITYTFHVAAWSPGYQPAERAVGPLAGNETQDLGLEADEDACSAPGYRPEFVYYEDFEADDGDFKATGTTSWRWGTPTSGPGVAHSGTNAWVTNPLGDYSNGEDGYAVGPTVDLSAHAGQSLYLSWWQWLQTEECCDFASAEVSNDGGTTWTRMYGEVRGNVDLQWTRHWVLLDPSYAVSDFRVRFRLASDSSITFPGYYVDDIGILPVSPPVVYSQDFEASNGGFTPGGATSWAWGAPASGPGSAHSGTNVWATNLAGNYGNNEDGTLESADIDLSAYAGQNLFVTWWQWLQTESLFDYASVEVSADGGFDWWTVYGEVSGNVDLAWRQRGIVLDPGYASSDFRIRFRLRSDRSVTYPGYYVDDLTVAASPPVTVACNLHPGGLVLGNVYDANTLEPLPGATVRNDSGRRATAVATEDPAVDDAFYALFSPAGEHAFTASMEGGYGTEAAIVTVVQSDTVPLDFHLGAGRLEVAPDALAATLDMGLSTTVQLSLDNTGGWAVEFALQEQDQGFEPLVKAAFPGGGPFSQPAAVGPLSVRSAERRSALQPEGASSPLAWMGGSAVPRGLVRYAHVQCPGDNNSFYAISGVDSTFSLVNSTWRYDADTDTWNSLAPIPQGQEGPTGVCYEGRIYVLGGGGTNQFYVYDIATGAWSAGPALPRNVWGAAAGAWDGRIYLAGGDDDFWFGGTSSQVDVYDIAAGAWVANGAPLPAAVATPGFVQAGSYLYVVGGWNDNSPGANADTTLRYDMAGNTWEAGPTFSSARADLAVALTSQYLYALGGDANGNGAFDPTTAVERLDWTAWPGGGWEDPGDPLPTPYTSNNGGFCTDSRAGGEVWTVGGFDGGSIVGTTWYRPSEGCFGLDVPWLTEEPVSGAVAAGDSAAIAVTFDASVPEVDQPGNYHAQLQVRDDSPYGPASIPVTLTVLAPASWGRLSGVVYSLGYCDAHTSTLQGADLLIEAGDGQTVTLRTGSSGGFVRWMEQGPYTVTVSAAGHLAQSFVASITPGGSLVHDIYVRADQPCLTILPSSFEVWLTPGTQQTRTLTLGNGGAQDLTYEILEMEGALAAAGQGTIVDLKTGTGAEAPSNLGKNQVSTPTTYHYRTGGGGGPDILLCADSCALYPPNTCGEVALRNLGVAYDFYYQDWYGCQSAIDSGAYSIVLADNACLFPDTSLYDALNNHLLGGGRAIVNSFDMDGYSSNPLWATAGVAYAADVVTAPPPPVYRWQAGHPAISGWPSDPLQFDDLYIDDGDKFDALPPAMTLAGYTAAPEAGQGSFALRRDNRAMVSGFCIDNLAWRDDDGDGTPDCAEVWQTATNWLLYPATDVPWLAAEPISGTVPPGSDLQVEVAFTAAPTMPYGTYTATLMLLNNDPVAGVAYVPAVMHVSGAPLCGFESSSPDDVGETTVFTNTTVGEPPLTFEWNLGDGTAIVASIHLTHTYAEVGLYTVVLTATNLHGPAACQDVVSIEGSPVARFESNSPVLLGQPAIFKNTSRVNPPATAWVWNFGDGGYSTDENPSHTYAAEGTYLVTLVAANARGSDTYQAPVKVALARIYLPIVVKNAGP
jgi:subtilisin family serine protease/PKD repeat protein